MKDKICIYEKFGFCRNGASCKFTHPTLAHSLPNYLSYLQWFQIQFLKVWGKNKRFLKILNFFFTRGPPGGILKILARFLLGVYWQCRTCTMKAIKGSWLLESHTQKIRKIAHTGAKLQSFLWGRGLKTFFGPPNFSKFLPIFHLQIALAQKPYLHFHFRFFSQNPKIHMSYLAKK